MRSFSLLAAAAALAVRSTYAQLAGSEDGPNNSTESGGTPTAQDGNRTIHYVDVAKGGHFYQPNSIQAEVGDIVSFRFYPTNHSVIRAKYGYPCIPYEDVVTDGDGFYSGFEPIMEISDDPPTWNLTVNSTEPVFYYCGAPGSCTDWGMVGAINANASTDIATQISLAKEADYMLLPGEPFPDEAINSMSSMAATATTATVTASPTDNSNAAASNTATHGHSSGGGGLSGGAIAGIVVGAVAALAILAALFFLLGRTKSMKKRLEEREQHDRVTSTMGPPSWMPANGQAQYFNPNTPHASAQLPPYGHPDHGFYEQKPPDETASLASGPMSPPLRGHSPPVPEMGMHPMPGFQNLPQQQQQEQRGGGYGFVGSTSELSGSEPMAAEIYTPSKDGTSPTGHPAYPRQ